MAPHATTRTVLDQPRRDTLFQADEIEAEILTFAATLDESTEPMFARLFTKLADVRTLVAWSESDGSPAWAELFLTHAETELQAATFEFLDLKALFEKSKGSPD
jgi:hypothetical protein